MTIDSATDSAEPSAAARPPGRSRSSGARCSAASWLVAVALVACSDGDSTPAFSYPFDENVPGSTTAPGNNVVTTVAPNEPGDDQPGDGVSDDLDGVEAEDGTSDDVDAMGGAGGVGGVGGAGGAIDLGAGGVGGLDGIDPDDPDADGFGGSLGLGGVGGTGGSSAGAP